MRQAKPVAYLINNSPNYNFAILLWYFPYITQKRLQQQKYFFHLFSISAKFCMQHNTKKNTLCISSFKINIDNIK